LCRGQHAASGRGPIVQRVAESAEIGEEGIVDRASEGVDAPAEIGDRCGEKCAVEASCEVE